MKRPIAAGVLAILCCGAGAQTARADFRFLAAPHNDLNRVYRVDTFTGEMGACQYAVQDSNVGVTLCFPAGPGAGAGDPGDYDLVASNHVRESGIFRIERRTGKMSVCYVHDERVVCTTAAR